MPQLSPKPSLTADGHVSSPASVASANDPTSQLAAVEGPALSLDNVKMEVKKEEEEDEGAEGQGDGKGHIERGSSEVKAEEKPEVRFCETVKDLEFSCESLHFSEGESKS